MSKKYSVTNTYNSRSHFEDLMAEIISLIHDKDEAGRLLNDVLSLAEVEEIGTRLRIAELLHQGLTYREVAKQTDTSTTTVTRVAQSLFKGSGGLKSLLDKRKISR